MTAAPTPATLGDVPASVTAELETFFAHAVPQTDRISPVVGEAASLLRDFVLRGGKRVRPTFAFAGWLAGTSHLDRSASVQTPAITATDALRICAALELVQACALIHDDIIDQSDTRRGHRTAHREFEAKHGAAGWAGDAARHGVSAAILAGDLALAWADDLVHGYPPGGDAGHDPTPLPPRVARTWSAMRTEVLGGQLLDIVNEVSGDETLDAAYRVMEYKTAAYTVARPLQLGAELAGAPTGFVDTLHSAGRRLGIAFQLRDDLLGVFGDPTRTGKPSGDDLIEGKRTALLAEGLARATQRDAAVAQRLRSAIGRPLSDAELTDVRTILVEVGAVAESERQISELLDAAVATLQDLPIGDGIRADLIAAADRLAHREA